MASATAASFDCRKAQTTVEKMICASNVLQILDLKLYEAYSRALRLSAKTNNVRADQLAWLRESRNECKTKECVENAYKARIATLESGINYKECEETASTVMQGYCEKRQTSEAENSIRDLTRILTAQYDSQRVAKFNRIQSEWRKNLVCNCGRQVGRIMGPGDSLNFTTCERKAVEQRLSEIREIVAGLHMISYGAGGPSCAMIRAEEDADPEHKIMQAITNNDIESVRKLLGEGNKLPLGDYLFTPLDIAARNNSPEMLSFLLNNGADPEEDIEAMMPALKTCNIKMVSLLVDHGYKVKGNPSYYGPYDPLPWAALFGCTDIIKYFVSKGADIKSSNPLRHAVMFCHVETVRYLLSKGIDPDSTDMEYTPLWYAAINAVNTPKIRSSCRIVISDLLQAGANPDRALDVPTNNPALKLPRNDDEIMKLLRSKAKANPQ